MWRATGLGAGIISMKSSRLSRPIFSRSRTLVQFSRPPNHISVFIIISFPVATSVVVNYPSHVSSSSSEEFIAKHTPAENKSINQQRRSIEFWMVLTLLINTDVVHPRRGSLFNSELPKLLIFDFLDLLQPRRQEATDTPTEESAVRKGEIKI